MRTLCVPVTVLTTVFALALGAAPAQNLLSSGVLPAADGMPGAGPAAGSASFADGTRAINQGRWDDAIAIFSSIASQNGDHIDGALYWKAYAQNKLGNSGQALETCTALLHQYPSSSWIEDCGALKIEIHAKNDQPVEPSAEQSDDLKLLALASLMRHNENEALAQINDILNGDSSERLKQGALFIKGEQPMDTSDPQDARVSYVEGDVRVSRGEEKRHTKTSDWEQAVANLPLQTGYSLVTGKGRAEIEFENDSTMYLGENSVLLFNDLHTTDGVPRTEVALLAGTVTLHIEPSVRGEWFVLKTPTDVLGTHYPDAGNFRVSAYMDGIAITTLDGGGVMTADNRPSSLVTGKTVYFKEGKPIIVAGPIQQADFSDWDKWAATRYTERQKETAAALKASGLATPIPGMADLAQAGTFFACEPYGTCWKPNAHQNSAPGTAPAPPNGDHDQPDNQAELRPADQQQAAPGSKIGLLGKPMPNPPLPTYTDFADLGLMGFPCTPDNVITLMLETMYPGYAHTLDPAMYSYAYYGAPWQWAVCHAGSWINLNNQYVWVAGVPTHQLPIRWIKHGTVIGFVPVHPYDIRGKAPTNDKNGFFAVNPKGVHPVERMALEAGQKVELLSQPPRVLRSEFVPPLARAEAPHMMAHEINDQSEARNALVKPTGTPITFDHRSQTFMMSREVTRGGRNVTVNAPINDRDGGLQARGFNGGGGNSGGAGGWRGGSNGGSSGGGFHGGGAPNSGGGAPSGGGATSGSGGGSSGSSGGGGHH